MSTGGWMIVAFLAVGAGVGGYLLSLVARLRQADRRMRELLERRARSYQDPTGPPSQNPWSKAQLHN